MKFASAYRAAAALQKRFVVNDGMQIERDAIEFLGAAEGLRHQKFPGKQEAGPHAALQL